MSPLFVGPELGKSAWDTLLAKLRLSGLPEGEDSIAIIQATLTKVRTGFYRRLGTEIVAKISTYRLIPNPGTDTQLIRSIAAECEVSWMRAELMRVLRFATIDANSPLQQANDEGMIREASGLDLGNEIKRLREDVEKSLQFLSGAVVLGEEASAQCATIEPARTFPPGYSLFHE